MLTLQEKYKFLTFVDDNTTKIVLGYIHDAEQSLLPHAFTLGLDVIELCLLFYIDLQFGVPFDCKKGKFRNPKDEILNNDFSTITVEQWNELLHQCLRGYVKTIRAISLGLTAKEIITLKLYTDFDGFQNEFKKCFKMIPSKDERQKQFYHCNNVLNKACNRSNDTMIKLRVFHGINTCNILSIMTSFYGIYYGPLSVHTKFDIAKQFANTNGRIIELSPIPITHKGLRVGWLSNFPDEDEALYFNASFQIVNIFTYKQSPYDCKAYDVHENDNQLDNIH
eukprot:473320_1